MGLDRLMSVAFGLPDQQHFYYDVYHTPQAYPINNIFIMTCITRHKRAFCLFACLFVCFSLPIPRLKSSQIPYIPLPFSLLTLNFIPRKAGDKLPGAAPEFRPPFRRVARYGRRYFRFENLPSVAPSR